MLYGIAPLLATAVLAAAAEPPSNDGMTRWAEQTLAAPDPKADTHLGLFLDRKSDGNGGAVVVTTYPLGPAAVAGIAPDDVIVRWNGERLDPHDPAHDIARRMRDVAPKTPVRLRVLRQGSPLSIEVYPVLRGLSAVKPSETRAGRTSAFAIPSLQRYADSRSSPNVLSAIAAARRTVTQLPELAEGLQLISLTPDLAPYFSTSKGLLVLRAPTEAALQLREGDVIQSIDGHEPRDGGDVRSLLNVHEAGERVEITVTRRHALKRLSVIVPMLE
jgi:S1-C subfamily serine protease